MRLQSSGDELPTAQAFPKVTRWDIGVVDTPCAVRVAQLPYRDCHESDSTETTSDVCRLCVVHVCQYCNKEFRDPGNFKQHETKFCRINPVTRIKYDEQKRLKEELNKTCIQHNNEEIKKWINYVNTLQIDIPEYETVSYKEKYKVIKNSWYREGNSVKYVFEHDYLASLIVQADISKCTVHHINENRQDNSLTNLMIFESNNDHKRFHNSSYPYLIYDENSHLFKCIKKQ